MFEVDPSRRGFDCTTYAGAASGLADGKGQGGTGQTIAEALSAEPCGVEDQPTNSVKQFFHQKKSGTFVMWSHGHVVFVKDGVVHEFTDRLGRDKGYHATEVGHWLGLGHHARQKFSVRKIELPT
jgi:hypothetical protein